MYWADLVGKIVSYPGSGVVASAKDAERHSALPAPYARSLPASEDSTHQSCFRAGTGRKPSHCYGSSCNCRRRDAEAFRQALLQRELQGVVNRIAARDTLGHHAEVGVGHIATIKSCIRVNVVRQVCSPRSHTVDPVNRVSEWKPD